MARKGEGHRSSSSTRWTVYEKQLIRTLAQHLGVSQAAVLRQALRQLARQQGFIVTE